MLDVVDVQIGQAAEQRIDRNLAFESGELRPNAVMDAAALERLRFESPV
jgi:hypothetical protein